MPLLKSFRFPHFSLLLIAACFISCKKDKDQTPPVISIISPSVNKSFAVFDTITVEANISDETQLKTASAQLLAENLTPALRLYSRTPSEKNYSLKLGYYIDDLQLASGNYYMCVSASDGVQETKEYVKVYISEAVATARGIVIVSQKNFNTVDISILDTNNSIQPFSALTSDYTSSCVSSKNQFINILGEQSGGLNSYKVETKNIGCNVLAPGTVKYFTHLDFYNEISYVCYYDGKIRGYDKNCASQFNAQTVAGYQPLKSFLHNTMLLVEEKEIAGTKRRLSVYYSTGALFKTTPISMEMVSFAKKDDSRILLFGNENGMGKILLYNISTDELFSPYAISEGKISDAAQITSNTYLVALPDGVYQYTYSPVNFIKHIYETNLEKIKYDMSGNRIIAFIGGTVKIYDYGSGQQLSVYYHSFQIKDIHFLFSK